MLPRYKSNPLAPGSPDLRDVSMEDWGNPTVDTGPVSLSQDGLLGNDGFRPMRGGIPKWQPGEFEEWKQAHMSGGSTKYGQMAQQAYSMRKIPGMLNIFQQGQARANEMAPHPALLALMKNGRR